MLFFGTGAYQGVKNVMNEWMNDPLRPVKPGIWNTWNDHSVPEKFNGTKYGKNLKTLISVSP